MTTSTNQIRPPINDAPTKSGSKLSDIWFRYFNNIYTSYLDTLTYGISVPTITTAQRDADGKYKLSRFIINTDATPGPAPQLQIWFNNAWQIVTVT